jgi:hypothetical protein
MGYLLQMKAQERKFTVVPCESVDVYDDIQSCVGGWQGLFGTLPLPGGSVELSMYCNEEGSLVPDRQVNAACLHFYKGPLYGDVCFAVCGREGEPRAIINQETAEALAMFFNSMIEEMPKEVYDAWEERWKNRPANEAGSRFVRFSSLEEMQSYMQESQKKADAEDKSFFEQFGIER